MFSAESTEGVNTLSEKGIKVSVLGQLQKSKCLNGRCKRAPSTSHSKLSEWRAGEGEHTVALGKPTTKEGRGRLRPHGQPLTERWHGYLQTLCSSDLMQSCCRTGSEGRWEGSHIYRAPGCPTWDQAPRHRTRPAQADSLRPSARIL